MRIYSIVVSILMCLLIGCIKTPEIENFIIEVGSNEIMINNEIFTLNAPVTEIDGHSYLPLRFMVDWLSVEKEISYEEKTERLSFAMKRGSYEMENYSLQVGSKDITVNNEALTLNAPVIEIDGHTFLPLRFFLDRYGAENILYDEVNEEVCFSLKRYEPLDPEIKSKYKRKESYVDHKSIFKKSCLSASYEQLARSNTHKGLNVSFTGKVVQVIEDGNNAIQLRVSMTKEEYYWTDEVFVSYTRKNNENRILEDDIITIWGVSNGLITYKAILGQNVTIPSINAKYIEVN
jgi:hypothetical protein